METNLRKSTAHPSETRPHQPVTISNSVIDDYISSLDDLEIKTLEIAKSHLGSSFNIKKSIGFIQWKEKQPVA
jgi:predicted transcriptional regulator